MSYVITDSDGATVGELAFTNSYTAEEPLPPSGGDDEPGSGDGEDGEVSPVNPDIPKTGDVTNLRSVPYVLAALALSGGLAVILFDRKRKKTERK